jgi:hypothetical protein
MNFSAHDEVIEILLPKVRIEVTLSEDARSMPRELHQ